MAKTIIAKYDGKCAACGKYHTKAGDTIKLTKKGWANISCCTIDPENKAKYDELRREAKARGLHLYDYLNNFKNRVAAEDLGGIESFT